VTQRPFLLFQRRPLVLNSGRAKLLGRFSFLIIILCLTSCVSAKYKTAAEDTPPPVPLNLSAEVRSVNAQIDTVIIYGGPGSWKREAYWDEYILSITNHGEHPVELKSATLTDFQGNPVMSGEDPWQIQEQSKEWIEHYDSGTTGVVLKVGAATIMTGLAVGGIVALGVASGGSSAFIGAAGAGAIAGAAAVVGILVVGTPIVILGTWGINVEARKQIEAEFQCRRLVLPAPVQPGQTVQGSLFFRITPGPQRLMLQFTGVDPELDVSVELAPLADLHIDTTPKEKQAQ
jgi:hypothetical protein